MIAVPTGAALAQGGDGNEIIVTATHRQQAITDVPFSINAQTAEDIARTGSTTLEELSRNVAGLMVQNLGPGQSQVSIRGVSAGQIVRDQPGVKEQVGVYLDESVISLSLFTPDLDLFDLNRVETLRGPQGTLFGSGSVGGTIRYITNQPDTSGFSGLVEGSLNTVEDGGEGGHIKGMVNVPLSDTAALRLVAYHTETAGFIDALREGGAITEDVNSGQKTGARLAVSFMPTHNLEVTPRLVYQKTEVDGFNREEVYNLYANPFTTTRPAVSFAERQQFLQLDEEFSDETFIADVTAKLELSDFDITSITSYTDRDILVSRDASALTGSVSVDPLTLGDPAVLLPSNLRDTTQIEGWTQEVRVASTLPGPFQWLVGVFYSDVDRFYQQRLPTPGYDAAADAALGAGVSAGSYNGFALTDSPYNSDLPYTTQQFAIFGEASYDLTDKLTVTAGGRYYDFEEDRGFHSGGLFSNGDNQTDSTESDGFSPRVLVSYDVNDEWTLNAQASKGFRLGGANDPLNLPLCSADDAATYGGFPRFEDETLWNYEGGFKYAGGLFSLNAAAFYTDIENLQVSADAGSCSSRVVFNVPEAHTAGLEVEFAINPMEGLELTFAGSRVESEFDSTKLDVNSNVLAGIREGNRLPSTPEYQIAATATYSFPVDMIGSGVEGFVSGSVQNVGTRFTQPGDQESNPRTFTSGLPFGGATGNETNVLDLGLEPYTLINLNAGVENDVWGVTFFVNNLADENASLAFDRERGGRARLGFHVNTPRTIGVTARRAF
jgi:outer membrane receptor protein involved in Fe transport